MNTVAPDLFAALAASGALRDVDLAFARTLRRLDPATDPRVLAAAALAALAVSEGHAGFDISDPQRLVDLATIDWPAADAWRDALIASRWVATPEAGDIESAADAPLVHEAFDGAPGLLYLRRYREYERRLAAGLRRIGGVVPDDVDVEALAPLFATLFPQAAGGEDLQARAAAVALRHNLVLITGGPGTGKTTTITRLLALLVARATRDGAAPPRIALAAPTGRAAERMAESLRRAVRQLADLGVDPDLLAALPTTGTTLHRLLGTLPDQPVFRHHADNPLPLDVVVVDEASMIDLPLMAKLVEAVPPGARLVLLGDPDQLPSVEAGDVLAGVLAATGDGRTLAADDQLVLAALVGADPAATPTQPSTPSTFPARHTHLTRGYRQSDSLDLAPLATAIRTGDADTALALLRSNTLAGVHFHEGDTDPLRSHRDHLLAHWRALAAATDPAEALALAGRLRILTAVRDGPQGARSLNARIEEMLGGLARRGAAPGHFHGRLILVTENSYRHGLFNGDTGICFRDPDGTVMAWFPGDDPAKPRAFHPAALPAHDSAFAMTVHKAQGSEFEEVWLVLPARGSRRLSREMLYTGLTRARSQLRVAAGAEIIDAAISRHESRWSTLGRRLGGESERVTFLDRQQDALPSQRGLFQ